MSNLIALFKQFFSLYFSFKFIQWSILKILKFIKGEMNFAFQNTVF